MAFALTIVFVALAAALFVRYEVLLRAHPVAAPGPAGEGLPSSVVAASRWTADVRNAALDPALVVFMSDDSDDGAILTVVGTGDQYRTHAAAGQGFLLSPDGSQLLEPDSSSGNDPWFTHVLNLNNATVDRLDGAALAFSPDGTQVAMLVGPSEAQQSEVQLVDLASHSVSLRVPVAGSSLQTAAAVSPDGSAMAVQTGDKLVVYRASGPSWGLELTGQNLAGPAAWTPDGQSLALANYTGKVTFVDAATGRHSTDPGLAAMPAKPVDEGTSARIVAWRDGAPIVATDNTLIELSAVAQTLLRAPDGTSGLVVATDRLAQPSRTPGTPKPGPLQQRYRVFVLIGSGLFLALAIATAIVGVLRRPKRAPRPLPSQAD
jgi:hypothetical protein